jgi:hypothetical protein
MKLTAACRNLVNELKNGYFKLLPGSSCKDRYMCPILTNKPSVCVGRHKILVTIVNMRFRENRYIGGGGSNCLFLADGQTDKGDIRFSQSLHDGT